MIRNLVILFLVVLGIHKIKTDVLAADFGQAEVLSYGYCLALAVGMLYLNRYWHRKKEDAAALAIGKRSTPGMQPSEKQD